MVTLSCYIGSFLCILVNQAERTVKYENLVDSELNMIGLVLVMQQK